MKQGACPSYEYHYLLAPLHSYHYLHQLDVEVSRYLKEELNIEGYELHYAAYLLVTYAIEVRADKLYPAYYELLKATGSKVNIRLIIVEEEGHLEEIVSQLKDFSDEWEKYTAFITGIEHRLYEKWIGEVSKQIAQIN